MLFIDLMNNVLSMELKLLWNESVLPLLVTTRFTLTLIDDKITLTVPRKLTPILNHSFGLEFTPLPQQKVLDFVCLVSEFIWNQTLIISSHFLKAQGLRFQKSVSLLQTKLCSIGPPDLGSLECQLCSLYNYNT